MKIITFNSEIDNKIINSEKLLIIQDIDGVCIPLVKDPLTRELNKDYILASGLFGEEFFVLTCGEHEGRRGVNRIVERSLKDNNLPKNEGLYLQGLAACGVEYQDNKGNISFEGVSKKEISFLSEVPNLMKPRFLSIIKEVFPLMENKLIETHISKSICKTRFSPTINFNSLFELAEKDWVKRKEIQLRCLDMMKEIIHKAESEDLKNSFFLHISPNLGSRDGQEIMKFSTSEDIGSTDIQLLVKGAVKDSGVLCLLNKYIGRRTGVMPFGTEFNFREAPKTTSEKLSFCRKYIKKEDMPLIIGVGDTVTSQKEAAKNSYQRGGSDRSFLEFIQSLGKEYGFENRIVFVDSSSGEVFRPSTKETGLMGITDIDDKLKFDIIFQNGPEEYIKWFINIANKRYLYRNS